MIFFPMATCCVIIQCMNAAAVNAALHPLKTTKSTFIRSYKSTKSNVTRKIFFYKHDASESYQKQTRARLQNSHMNTSN